MKKETTPELASWYEFLGKKYNTIKDVERALVTVLGREKHGQPVYNLDLYEFLLDYLLALGTYEHLGITKEAYADNVRIGRAENRRDAVSVSLRKSLTPPEMPYSLNFHVRSFVERLPVHSAPKPKKAEPVPLF